MILTDIPPATKGTPHACCEQVICGGFLRATGAAAMLPPSMQGAR
jgi:hypothetical protein